MAEDMIIETIPSNFIINIPIKLEFQDQILSDFMLKAIKIKNTSNSVITISKCVFEIESKGQIIQKVVYSEENIMGRIQYFQKEIGKFYKDKKSDLGKLFAKGNLEKCLGTNEFWNKSDLVYNNALKSKEETGLIHESFQVKANEKVDGISIIITYNNGKEEKVTSLSLPVKEYQNNSVYIFPVKGIWNVEGCWDDHAGHRIMYSQEFAFDLTQLDDDLMLPESKRLENDAFRCYNREVYAIADGEVVNCFDGIPENPTSYSDLEDKEIMSLAEKYGYEPLGPGNFVVIKHKGNEYSMYGHLKPQSLKVQVGDVVKQGDVIGHIGNSGNSTCPHLHFQLMDKKSTQYGRGLPCYFSNVKDVYGNQISLICQKHMIIRVE